MGKAKGSAVFFSDLRAKAKKDLLGKLGKLLDRLDLKERVKKNFLVAVKIHFGERGNTAFVRPLFVKPVVDGIKRCGGKPFLTDTNTLYVGSRGDSVSHYANAIENGFGYAAVGAPVVIAGGLRGNRSVNVTVNLSHYREEEIATEIADADTLVGITHFKGHEMSGFGGTLKNFGMGAASRQGKLSMHSTASPFVKSELCSGCRSCLQWCAYGALAMTRKKTARITSETCTGCGACLPTCPEGAIKIVWDSGIRQMQERMVEYAYGALHPVRERSLFINFLMNITPLCDCYPFSDAPIVQDIGIAASHDPVALDQASVDLVNRQPGNRESALKANLEPGEDKFRGIAPDIDWGVQLSYAEHIGLGSRSYRLIRV
jgi:uncharacterized Fe-S center protein